MRLLKTALISVFVVLISIPGMAQSGREECGDLRIILTYPVAGSGRDTGTTLSYDYTACNGLGLAVINNRVFFKYQYLKLADFNIKLKDLLPFISISPSIKRFNTEGGYYQHTLHWNLGFDYRLNKSFSIRLYADSDFMYETKGTGSFGELAFDIFLWADLRFN